MATQYPIDQNADRFIQGIKNMPDGSAVVDMEEDDMDRPDVEEQPDGSAIVNMPKEKGPEDSDFYENLAEETISSMELGRIALRYLDLVDKDKEARKERDKKYEEGLKRTGMGNEAPGGAQFMGASKVVHPIMAEACVDFASRAMKELFPPDGPVKTKIIGEVNDDKEARAERKKDWTNWQLTEQIEEFRDEQEQLLTQLPLGGSQYLKLWYDEKKKRPCAEFIAIDNMIIPFAASNFYTAQRAAEQQDITRWEFDQRVESGLYRDVDLIDATMEPEETAAEKANNKIEGRKWQDNEDGLRTVYHIYCYLSLDDDPITKGESAPYILMVDKLDSEVLGLYRNWEENDETMTKLDWVVEFKFIPWRGAYAIGLPHLIGGLAAALTGALRALLDTAHINNSATMLKLKGAKISGQSQNVEMTQVTEIEAGPGVNDIRQVAMPMPFNQPSPVLFELLGWLDKAAKGVVTTAEEKIADATSQMPVGTTQALIEQGAAVFSSIHARLHNSQRRVLQILGRINRWYLDDMRRNEMVVDLPITKEDFSTNSDIIPVSDPHIFSETQRMAQMQAVLQLSSSPAGMTIFDQRAVMTRMLKQLKIPDIQELIPNANKPAENNAADENTAMALGKSAFAYPGQDHLAHIQTHLTFALDPILGSNKLIAQKYVPQAMEHIKQHMLLWYKEQMEGYVTAGTNIKLGPYEDSKMAATIDKAFAVAGDHVKLDTAEVFKGVMPALEKLGALMQQMVQPPPTPPDAEAQAVLQASLAETQRRAARDQQDLQVKQQDLQARIAMNTENNLTAERMKAADLTVDEAKLQKEQERTALDLQRATQRNLGA